MRFFLYLIFLTIVLIIGFTNILANNTAYLVLTILLLVFNLGELLILKIKDPNYFYINPIVLGTLFTFLLAGGGLSNFFVLEDGEFKIRSILYQLESERDWLNVAMALTCIASMCTWIGYRSDIGINIFNWVTKKVGMLYFYKADINNRKLILLLIFAYLIKIYLFNIGMYGRLVSQDYFEAGVGFKQGSEIRILGTLSYLTFLLICINYFKKKKGLFSILFFISFFLEIFFGFLYGARSTFIIPFLILFVTKYYVTKKINVLFVVVGIFSLFLAITVVLDFKNYVLSENFVFASNPLDAIENYYEYSKNIETDEDVDYSENIASGLDFSVIPESAMAIRYKTNYKMDSDDPNFLFEIISFPYNAFVPKFIQGTTELPWGLWFKNKVLTYQENLKYSITITPLGFLYLSGGIIMVVLGFLLYGILLKMTFQYIFLNTLGFITFISLLYYLYNFDSVVSGTLVNITREVFIYPIIYYFVLGIVRNAKN